MKLAETFNARPLASLACLSGMLCFAILYAEHQITWSVMLVGFVGWFNCAGELHRAERLVREGKL